MCCYVEGWENLLKVFLLGGTEIITIRKENLQELIWEWEIYNYPYAVVEKNVHKVRNVQEEGRTNLLFIGSI